MCLSQMSVYLWRKEAYGAQPFYYYYYYYGLHYFVGCWPLLQTLNPIHIR
jgi:hypothetical protein